MELLNALSRIQERQGYLPQAALETLAREKNIPLPHLLGTADFYSHFAFTPEEKKDVLENLYPVRLRGILLNPDGAWQGYEKAKKAPEKIIGTVKASGLLGRSGGGFPAGVKWELTRDTAAEIRYVICNADEGEPGTGKDRALLQENPTAVIEGMAIAGQAVGATRGILYLRGEYADLRPGIEAAIAAAPVEDFSVEVFLGHGAYICGEETALIASIEGERAEPRLKPPYPGTEGLYGKPTVVNNVETFACVSLILREGAEAFRSRGTEEYPGPKLFTVLGAVENPGVYELAAGITLGELLEIAGGPKNGKAISTVLMGGGSGTVAKPDWELQLSPGSCRAAGASFGVASVRFLSEGESLIGLLAELTEFYSRESCGICVPCRVGLKRLADLFRDAEAGEQLFDARETALKLTDYIVKNARCAMAPAAVTPVVTALRNFPEVLA